MKAKQFEQLLECLTGTPVKNLSDSDKQFLSTALSDDSKAVDCSQFNELLLIAKGYRVVTAVLPGTSFAPGDSERA